VPIRCILQLTRPRRTWSRFSTRMTSRQLSIQFCS